MFINLITPAFLFSKRFNLIDATTLDKADINQIAQLK